MVIHSTFVLLFVACCCTMVDGNTNNVPNSDTTRQLQTGQTLNYRATYVADFHHFLDSLCSGDPPVLRLTCYGAKMNITSVSDTSIECNQIIIPDRTNGTSYECRNTCSGSSCQTIYESDDLDTPFGSITYTCEGNDYLEVDTYFQYEAGINGTCSTTSLVSSLPNFHIGRLGVSCPTDTGRKVVYDDTYFECLSPGSSALDLAVGNEDDIYACASGGFCEQLECEVMFSDFYIHAHLPNFLNECVDLNNIDLTTSPTSAPVAASSPFQYKVQFNASWADLYDSEFSRSSCTVEPSPIRITCENGASISSDNSNSCAKISDNELQCTGTATSAVYPFNSVLYDCVGPTVPTTRVTYTESSASCNGNSGVAIIDHAVTLGISCDIEGQKFFYYSDLVFDCADPDHNFEFISKLYGFTQTRYLCKESATFSVGSSSSNLMTIPAVAIATDYNWFSRPDGGCFQTLPNAPMSSPVAAPVIDTDPPTPGPTVGSLPTASPLASPTVSPLSSPTMTPLASLSTSPSMTPMKTMGGVEEPTTIAGTSPIVPIEQKSNNGGSNSSTIGIVIGSIGGGFAFVAALALLVFLRQRNNNNNNIGDVKAHNASYNTDFYPTESHTDDDYTKSGASSSGIHSNIPPALPQSQPPPSMPPQSSSRPPPQQQHHQQPVQQMYPPRRSYNDNDDVYNKHDRSIVYMPTTVMPVENNTRAAAAIPPTFRSSYPTQNHVVDVKDQCRSVIFPNNVTATTPTSSPHSSTTNVSIVPMAVAVGVNSDPSAVVDTPTSSSRRKQAEPSGRVMLDC